MYIIQYLGGWAVPWGNYGDDRFGAALLRLGPMPAGLKGDAVGEPWLLLALSRDESPVGSQRFGWLQKEPRWQDRGTWDVLGFVGMCWDRGWTGTSSDLDFRSNFHILGCSETMAHSRIYYKTDALTVTLRPGCATLHIRWGHGSLQGSQSGCRFVAQPKVISTVERLNLENMTGQDVGERLFGCLKLGRMLMTMFFFDSCGVVGDGSKPSVASSRGSHWPAILVTRMTRVAVLANTRRRKQIKHSQFVLLPATGWNDSKSLQKIRRLLSQRGIEYAIAKIRWIPSWDSGTTWGRTKAMWDKPEKSWKQIYAAALVPSCYQTYEGEGGPKRRLP